MKTCLIAERSHAVRKVAAGIISSLGLAVITAPDDADLATLLVQTKPDILLIDEGLTGLESANLLRSLRAGAHGRAPYLLVLTLRRDTASLAALLEAGADDILIKPFDAGMIALKLAAAGLVPFPAGSADEAA
ncbi:MAG: response regulator [Hyphomonas sp.]|uniref:response regulator n=1 Tax=Hyphomonas sp. TaxID=87 RepID=UPI0035283D85